MLIRENSILSHVVRKYVVILPMLNRFDIKLGLGEENVHAVCQDKGIDVDFFLHIANSFIDPTYLKRVRLTAVYPKLLADYLKKTNLFYIHAQVPNIEVHLRPFIMNSKENASLQLLERFLGEFKRELLSRIQYDNETLIPYFLKLSGQLGEEINQITLEKYEGKVLIDKSEGLISDIQDVMIKHLSGDFNDNLCYAVLFALSMIEKDLSSNNRLRQRIFFPMLRAMEERLNLEPHPLSGKERQRR